MSERKLIVLYRRTLDESDRDLFVNELGDLPIREYKVISAGRWMGENTSETIEMFLCCRGKLLHLYTHPYNRLVRFGKLAILSHYDDPRLLKGSGDYKTFTYSELLAVERSFILKIEQKVLNDTIEDEELNYIREMLAMPIPQLYSKEEKKAVQDIVGGILVSDNKGGFIMVNPDKNKEKEEK